MVVLPWGSRSMTNTLRLVATKDADKLTVVVVLPTPPFWLATAIIRPTKNTLYRRASDVRRQTRDTDKPIMASNFYIALDA